jgi:hypothetical protein
MPDQDCLIACLFDNKFILGHFRPHTQWYGGLPWGLSNTLNVPAAPKTPLHHRICFAAASLITPRRSVEQCGSAPKEKSCSDHQPLHLGSLRAFLGADLTGLATGFAFGNIGKLLAFRLAGLADLFNALGDGPHIRGIDCGQCLQSAASHDDLIGRVGATGHARILHRIHTEAMPEAIVASRDAMGSGFLKRLVFRQMHGLFARLRKGL